MAVGGPFREYRLTCLLFLSLRLSLHNSAGYDLCMVMVAAIDMLEQGVSYNHCWSWIWRGSGMAQNYIGPNYVSRAFTLNCRLSSYNSRGTSLNVEQLLLQQYKHSLLLPSCIDCPHMELTKLTTLAQVWSHFKECQIFRVPQQLYQKPEERKAVCFHWLKLSACFLLTFSCVFVLLSSDDEDDEEDTQEDVAAISFIKSKIPSEKVKPVKSFEVVYPLKYGYLFSRQRSKHFFIIMLP